MCLSGIGDGELEPMQLQNSLFRIKILNLNDRTSASLHILQDADQRKNLSINGPKTTLGGSKLSFCTKASSDSILPFLKNPVGLHFSDKWITFIHSTGLNIFSVAKYLYFQEPMEM